MLSVDGIQLRVGQFALRSVSFRVEAGERLVLLGPTGCGKTLLAETVCGLRRPDAGRVILNGRDISQLDPAKRNIGYVPQDYALLPFKTVEGNVAFGLEARRLPRRQVAERVGEMLDLMNIAHLAQRFPAHLSGGERQRVALSRALAIRPDLLVLDEPLSALDEGTGEEMIQVFHALRDELSTTTLHICHRLEEAFAVADTLALLRDGRIEQIASPREMLSKPRNRFVAQFLRLPNLIEGEVRETGEGRAFCLAATAWAPTDCPAGPACAIVPLDTLALSLTEPPDAPGKVVVADTIAENRAEAFSPCLRFYRSLNLTVPGVFPAREWRKGRTAYISFPRDKVHVLPLDPPGDGLPGEGAARR